MALKRWHNLGLCGRERRAANAGAGCRARPRLEVLEERTLLAVFTVVDIGDGGVGSGLEGDLRYCVETADANGDLSNRIVFQPGLTGTVSLRQGRLFVDKNLEIDGPGADLLTISGNHLSGVFEITTDPRARDVRIAGVTIADGIGVFTSAGHEGGGLFNWHADVTLSNCALTGNVVGAGGGDSGRGGAIYSVAGNLTLTNCTIADNHAEGSDPADGGGIYLAGGALSLNHCTVSGNSAASEGGGLFNLNGVLTASNTTVSGNTSVLGGGIDDHNRMTLTNCTIADNVTSGSAAGISAQGFDTLINCTIVDNAAGGVGGGIYNSGISQLTLSGCTIAGNSAAQGGGLWWVGGAVTATNCTFSGNSADGGTGGAILMVNASQGSSLEMTSCTLTQNSAADGGGLAVGNASILVLVRNTILAGNQASGDAVDARGAVLSLGHNLVGEVDGSTGWQATDLTGTGNSPLDPRLGPLQDNGGPTLTHAPFADSPAIDNGDPVLYRSVDQRGTFRNFDGVLARPDVGAVEAQSAVAFRLILPDRVTAGQPFAVTVVALDQWGNTATTYAGTVHFDSTDLGAVLPADYTFASGDQGRPTLVVTLNTPGSQAIRITDVNNPSLRATASTVVDSFCDLARDFGAWGLDAAGWHRRA